jgi:hypothetical protein
VSKKILNIEYDFFTLDEVYELYNGLIKDIYNSSTKENLISFLLEFKKLEEFVKYNKIAEVNVDKLKMNNVYSFNLSIEKEILYINNYPFLNLSLMYNKNINEDLNELIDKTNITYVEKSGVIHKNVEKLRNYIKIYKSERETIKELFKKIKKRDVIFSLVEKTIEKDINVHQKLFFEKLNDIKELYNIVDIFDINDIKKIKKIQNIYVYILRNNFDLKQYDYLSSNYDVNDINKIFPYILNKYHNLPEELFEKLNEQNKALATSYMLEKNPSNSLYLKHLQQTVKKQEEFYRKLTNSKKVILLIDRYTNKTVIDMKKYMEYENSVVFQFNKKDILDLMPHVEKNIINNFFSKNFPVISKKMTALTYNGVYTISYRTEENITTKEFVNKFLENITSWVEEDLEIKHIEEFFDNYLRSNNLTNLLNKSDKNKELIRKKKI